MKFGNLFRKKPVEELLKHEEGAVQLNKNLGVRDLTSMGIAAIIGAGIFSTIGTAASNGGPAVSLLFVFTAIACGLSALCYAHFAAMLPISGSAYTYSYASFGELIAWIIGWDLIMEYAVGNIAVAISWSDYFTGFCSGLGVDLPAYFCTDYLSATRGFAAVTDFLSTGGCLSEVKPALLESYNAWMNAPQIGGIRIIADLPAFFIVVLITYLVYRGIYESKVAGNIMVLLKLLILFLIILIGAFYVDPENWSPFAPNGISGVLKGVSGVFFAYIGFDAISTTAEECKNPRRDLPKSMILSLVITTLLYVLISLVLTGMVSYKELGVGDPLAYVFARLQLNGLSGVIAFSAIIAMASVMLVFQVGQPRIWMSMSRDGLLPKVFSKIHKRYKTPAFATIITGIFVAIPTLFMNLTEVTDLTSIGTLFAFVLVSGGVIVLGNRESDKSGFRVPYFSSRFILPVLWSFVFICIFIFNKDGVTNFYVKSFASSSGFGESVPMHIFILSSTVISLLAIKRKWSLIPVLSLLTNLYLLSELGVTNWLRFIVWLAIGLVIYFAYGVRKSKLNKLNTRD